MAQHTFHLTEAQATFIEEMIASGRYVDGSDFVRDLIRRKMESSAASTTARTVTPRQIQTRAGRSVLQAVATVERESEQYVTSCSDVDGIPASRLGDLDVQQAILHDRTQPTVLLIHQMPTMIFIPKSMQVEADPTAESIGLSRLISGPGGVYQIVAETGRVHPLTKHGKLVGYLVAYEDARDVLRGGRAESATGGRFLSHFRFADEKLLDFTGQAYDNPYG